MREFSVLSIILFYIFTILTDCYILRDILSYCRYRKKAAVWSYSVSSVLFWGLVTVIAFWPAARESSSLIPVMAVPPVLGANGEGVQISKMVESEGGVAGINAGGFIDVGGVGNGGEPLGIVIKDGKLLYDGGSSIVIGFDKDDKLIVG